jgi:hypothetical protein
LNLSFVHFPCSKFRLFGNVHFIQSRLKTKSAHKKSSLEQVAILWAGAMNCVTFAAGIWLFLFGGIGSIGLCVFDRQ